MNLNNSNIVFAVQLWIKNKQDAINKYGLISDWGISKVTNMQNLFFNFFQFNDDINNWNVSNVTNMSYMFFNAKLFNQNIGMFQICVICFIVQLHLIKI